MHWRVWTRAAAVLGVCCVQAGSTRAAAHRDRRHGVGHHEVPQLLALAARAQRLRLEGPQVEVICDADVLSAIGDRRLELVRRRHVCDRRALRAARLGEQRGGGGGEKRGARCARGAHDGGLLQRKARQLCVPGPDAVGAAQAATLGRRCDRLHAQRSADWHVHVTVQYREASAFVNRQHFLHVCAGTQALAG
jgi:hypothetical protein